MSAHPFTEATLAVVSRKLDNALAHLEHYIDGPAGELKDDTSWRFSDAYRELLQIRGMLHAAQQLEVMTADVEKADTERPKLTVVK